MKKKRKDLSVYTILTRYIILLILVLCLPFFYFILKYLTLTPLLFFLKLFFPSLSYIKETIILNSTYIKIIPACIAGSAYMLLLILNIAVPIKAKTRVYSLLFSLALLFIINLARLFFLSIIFSKYKIPILVHNLSWLILSTLIVIGIWFLTARLFSIKETPFYSDLKKIKLKLKK